MLKYKPYLLITAILLTLLFTAFQDSEMMTKEQFVQIHLNEKLQKYKIEKAKKCRQKAIDQATQIVDSILISQARNIRIDTVQRPPKPIKPSRPNILSPNDTTPIRPVIE